MTKYLLRIEGSAVLLLALYFYTQTEMGWGWFFLLLLAPDLSMFGYMVNKKIGSYVYNLIHTYSLPLLLINTNFFLATGISSSNRNNLGGAYRYGSYVWIWLKIHNRL